VIQTDQAISICWKSLFREILSDKTWAYWDNPTLVIHRTFFTAAVALVSRSCTQDRQASIRPSSDSSAPPPWVENGPNRDQTAPHEWERAGVDVRCAVAC
jgi:hypothetical protein